MKVLVLLSRVPYPLEKGDKLRAFNQIKWLSQHYRVVLCCINDRPLHPKALEMLEPYCEEIKVIRLHRGFIYFRLFLGLFGKKPLQVTYFYSRSARKQIDRLVEKHLPKHIFCQLVRIAEYARKYTIIPKTLDYMDALSTGAERRIKTAPFYLKALLRTEAKRLIAYEAAIFNEFENRTIISEQDRQLIGHPDKGLIHIIPNGVDTDFFRPMEHEKDYDLVFTGNMSYPPNIDSARFIANEIVPLILKEKPDLKVLISGAAPVAAVRSLQSKHVTVTGWVADIRESYARSKVFLAPMQIGTGLQNKLLEAMAMKLPCITSDLANNALQAIDGETVLIGDRPQAYANHVLQLLNNIELYHQLQENGYRFVLNRYNWEQTTGRLAALMAEDDQ